MSLIGGSILAMALSTLLFVGGHFVLSHLVREPLTRAIGAGGFRGLYSVVAAVGLAWMIWEHKTAPYVELWGDPRWARHLLMLTMFVAVLLFVPGLMTPNPGVVGAEKTEMDYREGLGIHAVTRHPGLWGFGLWGIGHAIANGDLATVILAGGIAVLAFGGMAGIDARKLRSHPQSYGPFVAHTSAIPFAAMIAGRTRLNVAKLGLVRIGAALIVYVLLLFFHQPVIGRSALPI